MRQTTHADPIDPGFGDFSDCGKAHSARGLQLNLWCACVAHRDRFPELLHSHIVNEHNIRLCCQGRFKLSQ